MLKRKILSALVALSVGAGGAAFGQGNPRADDLNGRSAAQGQGHQNARAPDRAAPRAQVNQRGGDRSYRGDQRSPYRGQPQARNGGHEGRGAGPGQAWYRGDRLPSQYNNRQYVVDDWRGHHLSAPPRGYHWVQAGGDYVLAAIATGIIASILLNQ